MIIRNSITLYFNEVEDALRRADLFIHDGNYEDVLTFMVLDGENKGKTCLRATHLTHKKEK